MDHMAKTTTALTDSRQEAASYATLSGASQAVAHLVEVGFDEHEVAIAPRQFRALQQHPLRRRVRLGMRAGSIMGSVLAAVAALTAVAGLDSIVGVVAPLIVFGALAGTTAGLVVGLAVHLRARRHQFGDAPAELAPERFDVTVDHEFAEAEHALAQWWDPAAPPASRTLAA